MINSKWERLWDYKDHLIVLIECDWKFMLSVIGDYKCQLMLISYWHARLPFAASTGTMLVCCRRPTRSRADWCCSRNRDLSENTCSFAWVGEAALVIIHYGLLPPDISCVHPLRPIYPHSKLFWCGALCSGPCIDYLWECRTQKAMLKLTL